jgi:hypothetical protein
MIEEPKAQRVCCDCGTVSPAAHTSHTLISKQHGWRLIRALTANGEMRLEWRCPPCWKAYRAKKPDPVAP